MHLKTLRLNSNGHCGESENKVSFNPIPSKPFLRDFDGALRSHHHSQIGSGPLLAPAFLTGQQELVLLSLLLMNLEMLCH